MGDGKREIPARFSWDPGAVAAGAITAAILFLALAAVNWPLIRSDFSPAGDLAADMLLIERAHGGWLLTGHYSLTGANHPGPYFLYARFLGEALASSLAGGPFGGQLFGTFANSALFLGLFAALVHQIARRNGATGWTALAAAVAAALLMVFQLSSVTGRTAYGEGLRVSLADPWMPDALIAPFLTFLTASLLLAEGGAGSLVVAVFCGAVLVHGYAPMPVIVGPVWLVAVWAGGRARRRAGAGGFPRWSRLAAGAIIAAFLTPIVADAMIGYPGNIGRIIQVSALGDPGRHGVGAGAVVRMLAVQWGQIHPFSWAWAVAGLGISLVTGRSGTLWRNAVGLAALAAVLAFPACAPSPVGLQEYQTRFFIGGALLLASAGIAVSVAEAGRRHRAAPAVLVLCLLPVTLQWGSLTTPAVEKPVLRDVAARMAADVPAGGRVVVDGSPRLVVASLLLELGRFKVKGCSRDAEGAYLYTPERICPDGEPYDRAYRVAPRSPCRPEASSPLPERITRSLVLPVQEDGPCLVVTPNDGP